MNAVILYDRFEFAVKAGAMLRRVAERADETVHWVVMPWRLDILEMPAAAEQALAEAAGAHLILLAMRQADSLAAWLLDWLERWAKRRQIMAAALAMWVGGAGNTVFGGTTPELSTFAERHGLILVRSDEGIARARGPHSHWGINE
jgi:hypothetical protein